MGSRSNAFFEMPPLPVQLKGLVIVDRLLWQLTTAFWFCPEEVFHWLKLPTVHRVERSVELLESRLEGK